MIIPSLNPAETRTIENMDSTAVVASHFGLTQTPLNAVDGHTDASSPAASGPTEGARGSTVPLTGYARTKEMVEERLADRPDYQELKTTLSQAEQLASDFALVEANSLCAGDGVLVWADILAVIDDPLRPGGVREAAARLRNNPTVWEGFAKGDNRASTGDVAAFIAGLKSQMKAIRDEVSAEVKADVKAEQGAAAGNAGSSTGTSAAIGQTPADPKAAAAAQIRADSEAALPKPPPSQFAGLEGASENMNNMIGWGEAEIDRLTQLMSKTDDPAVLKQLENKVNQMTRRMQQMTALMNQVMTMMSNISKMYSDIAMNSVRNLR